MGEWHNPYASRASGRRERVPYELQPSSDYLDLPSYGLKAGATGKRMLSSPNTKQKTKARKGSKALLAEALQKANDAVSIDDQGDSTRAVIGYTEACDILQRVMLRIVVKGDVLEKLQLIKDRYEMRIGELHSKGLVAGKSSEVVATAPISPNVDAASFRSLERPDIDAVPSRSLSGLGLQRGDSRPLVDKSHNCPYCSTEFLEHHDLKNHLLSHSSEEKPPYLCQTCDFRFRRPHDLKRHTKVHARERRITCSICHRSFARNFGYEYSSLNKEWGYCTCDNVNTDISKGSSNYNNNKRNMAGMTSETLHEPNATDEGSKQFKKSDPKLPADYQDQPHESLEKTKHEDDPTKESVQTEDDTSVSKDTYVEHWLEETPRNNPVYADRSLSQVATQGAFEDGNQVLDKAHDGNMLPQYSSPDVPSASSDRSVSHESVLASPSVIESIVPWHGVEDKITNSLFEIVCDESHLGLTLRLIPRLGINSPSIYEEKLRSAFNKWYEVLQKEAVPFMQQWGTKQIPRFGDMLAVRVVADQEMLLGGTEKSDGKETVDPTMHGEVKEQLDIDPDYRLGSRSFSSQGNSRTDSNQSDDRGNDLPLQAILNFVRENRSFVVAQDALMAAVWDRFDGLWQHELGTNVPLELKEACADVRFVKQAQSTISDRCKRTLEAYSKESWDWWPLQNPQTSIPTGKTRILWRNKQNSLTWADLSLELAEKQKMLQDHLENILKSKKVSETSDQEPSEQLQPQNDIVSSASSSGVSSSSWQDGSSETSQSTNMENTPGPAAGQLSTDQPHSVVNIGEQCVLVCGNRDTKIIAREIVACQDLDDDAFFRRLRELYPAIVGKLRYLLSLRTFSHCEFGRFMQLTTGSVEFVFHELPCSQLCQPKVHHVGADCSEAYDYRLILGQKPMISKTTWQSRFNEDTLPSEARDIVEMIPKRNRNFGLDSNTGRCHGTRTGRSEMVWGLHIATRPSFFRSVIWLFVVCLGPCVFWIYWLIGHPGDLQSASVPIITALTGIGTLAIMLHWRFNDSHCSRQCTGQHCTT